MVGPITQDVRTAAAESYHLGGISWGQGGSISGYTSDGEPITSDVEHSNWKKTKRNGS